MQQRAWDRRDVLWGLSVMAGAGVLGAGASPAAAQQVKYSSGTEPDSLLEEAVLSELVSEAKFPGNWEKYRDFYRRDLRVRLLARNP